MSTSRKLYIYDVWPLVGDDEHRRPSMSCVKVALDNDACIGMLEAVEDLWSGYDITPGIGNVRFIGVVNAP